jgi:hypothetical protein
MSVVSGTLQRASSGPRNMLARGLYITVVLVMTGIVLAGFWPFYAALPTGGNGAHGLLYVHAAVFSGWMILIFSQAVLVFRRRVRVHQRLGRVAVPYGLSVLVLGVAVTFVVPAEHVTAGRWTLDEAAGFLILPLGDMLLFAGFFTAGIAFRRQMEIHKRLMVLATMALLFAPAARIGADAGPGAMLAIWLFPLALAIAHDAVTRRRLEPVYLFGTLVLLVAFSRIALMEAESWLIIGRRLLAPFL